MIRILYFASLRERLGSDGETVSDAPGSVAALRAALAARGGDWQQAFAGDQRVLVAVNQEMADDASLLKDGDEVGFFPPVTGG
ncbi:MAG: molybdopterin converting factor subunit 1 [Gammaproteobacteria bacterium]|nr:molybdopterin converting factor subunit 1 [Gammaproteobacteria bacterium]